MADDSKSGKKGGSGLIGLVAVFGVVTVLAVGAGWFVGSQIRVISGNTPVDQAAAAQPEADLQRSHESEDTAGNSGGHGAADATVHGPVQNASASFFGGPSSVKLEPIVSNIGSSGDEWVRLEIAVIYGSDAGTIPDAEVYTVSEAIIGMLRRKSKSELSGPSGFLQFREDLVDTVRISTAGRATSAKILSMVVE